MPLEGTVKSLGIAVSKLSPMDQVDKIELITGQGIVGDRH